MDAIDLSQLESPGGAAPSPVAAIKQRWQEQGEPDAVRALAENPEFLEDKSLVLDLAYEEFLVRQAAGEDPDLAEFCGRFPRYRTSLHNLLAAHQFFDTSADLLGQAPAVVWPEEGQEFGGYRLIRELGRGAFARVYLASEEATGGRLVALKVSPEEPTEARKLGRLEHPNIVPVLSAPQVGGFTTVCMRFLGTATLHDVLDRSFPREGAAPPREAGVILRAAQTRLRPGEQPAEDGPPDPVYAGGTYVEGIARLALQLAEALAFVHARNVCHRDLKPSNVLLTRSGRPLLLDFNLSADGSLPEHRLGGTLPYMAPEQLRCVRARSVRGEELGPRADLFAFGVIFYELFTGKHPFGPVQIKDGPETVANTLLGRQRAGFEPLRDQNPEVPARLARLIEQCLAFDPAGRPESADVLVEGFRHYFRPVPVLLRRMKARLPELVAAAGTVLLGGAILARGGALPAVLPPAPESAARAAYQAGMERVESGDYEAAECRFTEALDAVPNNPDYLLARGLARLRQSGAADKAREALDDFNSALRFKKDDGPTLAAIAACHHRLRDQGSAEVATERALKAGYESVALRNNRAFWRIHKHDYEGAAADLREALRRDPACAAALYNRAWLEFSRAQTAGRPLPASAFDDIDRAIRSSVPSARLYRDAAWMYAYGASLRRPDERQEADARARALLGGAVVLEPALHPDLLRCEFLLRQAVKLGIPRKAWENEPLFKESILRRYPDLPALMPQDAGNVALPPNTRLMDPLPGFHG